MKNKPLCITDFLSVGEQNAIKAKSLAKILGWNERDVTIAVNALRKNGEFICSCSNGRCRLRHCIKHGAQGNFLLPRLSPGGGCPADFP